MTYCQAGGQRFLRVITIGSGHARESLELKLSSCRENIELADDGVQWNCESRELHLHWLEGPTAKGASEDRTILIGPGGAPP